MAKYYRLDISRLREELKLTKKMLAEGLYVLINIYHKQVHVHVAYLS